MLDKVIELNPHLKGQFMQSSGLIGHQPFAFGSNPFGNNVYPNMGGFGGFGGFGEKKANNILIT